MAWLVKCNLVIVLLALSKHKRHLLNYYNDSKIVQYFDFVDSIAKSSYHLVDCFA